MDSNRGHSRAAEARVSANLSWALVLGSSSGIGAATAAALAEEAGLNVIGVHLRRSSDQDAFEDTSARIEAAGKRFLPFNMNAANPDRRREALDEMEAALDGAGFRVFFHSLSFGTLKPFIADEPNDAITEANMDMTLRVMAHSLVYWTQDLVARKMLCQGSRIFAMTSAGAHRALPNYGAVSAAKAALESHVRQLTLELASRGISVNGIEAGVTDTPALRKVPGYEKIVEVALMRNPSARLTTPEDVAHLVALLAKPGSAADWLSGGVLKVDGGEDAVG